MKLCLSIAVFLLFHSEPNGLDLPSFKWRIRFQRLGRLLTSSRSKILLSPYRVARNWQFLHDSAIGAPLKPTQPSWQQLMDDVLNSFLMFQPWIFIRAFILEGDQRLNQCPERFSKLIFIE